VKWCITATTAAAAIILFSIGSLQAIPGMAANDFVRMVIANELRAQDQDYTHCVYRVQAEDRGRSEVREVIESKDGDLSRLLSVNGRPLSEDERRNEDRRLEHLAHDPGAQRSLKQARNHDGDEARRLLKSLPDASLFTYKQGRGDSLEPAFIPSPDFRPPSYEAHVFHEMEGEIWVNTKQNRLEEISGHTSIMM
jgi:hypothetical protein